jgi:serine/threonine protein kinase
MAPEQFKDVDRVDIRADVYSFGVLLHEMIAGSLPFDGNEWDELKEQHQNRAPAPLPVGVPGALAAIVNTCLAKDPAARFSNFASVRGELTAAYQELAGAPTPERPQGVALDAVEWSNKGASLSHLDRYNEALDCYTRALDLNPRLKEAWNKPCTGPRSCFCAGLEQQRMDPKGLE